MMKLIKWFNLVLTGLVAVAFVITGFWIHQWIEEGRVLRQVVERLSADSRMAEVLVTKSEFDEKTRKIKTTIKFLEYDAEGNPLPARHFSFQGNIIQFQSLVIRFKDQFVKAGDKLRGKSACLFTKVFILDGPNTQEFNITETEGIPSGYKIPDLESEFEKNLWALFWDYALNPETREHAGIKNAQIEAPGTMFLPGTIYTLVVEHDGGIRIDSQPVPEILKGESVPPPNR